eukprot:evm.model.scf_416.5 EVM.evm.TU.scf_416.5   scf_416:66259-78048(-)
MQVILLSGDRENRRLAREECGAEACSVQEYARMRTDDKELLDLAAHWGQQEFDEDDESEGKSKKRRRIYEDHRPLSSLTQGIKNGTLHQGVLNVSRYCWHEGFVPSSIGQEIRIEGVSRMNRAMAGDVVVVEIVPDNVASRSGSRPGAADGPDADEEDDGYDVGDETTGLEASAVHGVDDAICLQGPQDDDSSTKPPSGQVVGIIKRAWRTRGYCGTIMPPRDGKDFVPGRARWVRFRPKDRRFPHMMMRTAQADQLLGKNIVAVVEEWQSHRRLPDCRYVRTIGTVGDTEAETDVLLMENDIATSPFTPEVLACLPPLPWDVGPADVADPHRRDLRHLCVCSVDPPGCKDIDDALHVRLLPNGNYELGVHIADVTHFVKPETALDTEAAQRGTTVYLVQRRIDMLPKALTEDICSLRGNVDRLAFSVLWEATLEGDVLHDKTTFTKSIIRSRAALTYEEAQTRIDDDRLTDDVSMSLKALARFGQILRKRRMEKGALELASPEVKLSIDTESLNPTDIGLSQVRLANKMVEEMMLLANSTVAEKILSRFPSSACLRRHPAAPRSKYEPLLKALEPHGVSLDVTSNKRLAETLDGAVLPGDPFFNTIVRMMATRCMNEAQYFGAAQYSRSEYYHFGLAMDLYTHFTSPIRRYADCLVHRFLAASMDQEVLPASAHDVDTVKGVTDNLNVRHRNAQFAGRASVTLFTLIYFKQKGTVTEAARVVGLRKKSVIVFVPKYGIEGMVGRILSGGEEAAKWDYVMNKSGNGVVSQSGKRSLKVFDSVTVRIEVKTTQGYEEEVIMSLVDEDAAQSADADMDTADAMDET